MRESLPGGIGSLELTRQRTVLYKRFTDVLGKMDRVGHYGSPANMSYMDAYMLLLANSKRVHAFADLVIGNANPTLFSLDTLHKGYMLTQQAVHVAERQYRSHLREFTLREGIENPYNTSVIECGMWFTQLQKMEETVLRNAPDTTLAGQPTQALIKVSALAINMRIAANAMQNVSLKGHECYMQVRSIQK